MYIYMYVYIYIWEMKFWPFSWPSVCVVRHAFFLRGTEVKGMLPIHCTAAKDSCNI